MGRLSTGIAAVIRSYCDLECQLDHALVALGRRRRFFAQKGQDRWLTTKVFCGQVGGYFVDVGAGNGVTHSNTYVLERDFGWTGLLVEANPKYADEIRRTRHGVCIPACVDSEWRVVDFLCYGYLGGIVANDTDNSELKRPELLRRREREIMRIPAQPLDDILIQAGAPFDIDYLSIDVEGAEHRVLRGLSFVDFSVKAITIERPSAESHKLLTRAGFVLAKYRLWDGFYLAQPLATELGISPKAYARLRGKPF